MPLRISIFLLALHFFWSSWNSETNYSSSNRNSLLGVAAFSNSRCVSKRPAFFSHHRTTNTLLFMTETMTTTTTTTTSSSSSSTASSTPNIVDRSTLLLLEHINLNVPQHEPSLSLHVQLLGMGLDPRRAQNVNKGEGTIWTNCGPCQFHLPHGPVGQRIPGHIGLRYDSLEPLKQRLSTWKSSVTGGDDDDQQAATTNSIITTEVGSDPNTGREFVKITDAYRNVFYCRVGRRPLSFQRDLRQPLVTDQDVEEFGQVATKFGVPTARQEESKSSSDKATATAVESIASSSDCRGVEYVEFPCRFGTADRIAQFYDKVFDATTSVMIQEGQSDNTGSTGTTKIAVIGFGDIDENGQAEQSLVFREVSSEDTTSLEPYDGHHIALYVGETALDFEKAFENCQLIDIVWINPRFKDNAMDVAGARYWNQFRFKEIVDLKTGEPLLELEHEVRCIEHEAWPAGKK